MRSTWIVTTAILVTMAMVFVTRTLVVTRGWRSHRPGPDGTRSEPARGN